VRKALPAHPKLHALVVDYDHLPDDADWWRADAVICTLGTTLRVAGSQEAFRRVDHDYPLAVARLARKHGTPVYALNSAMGADVSSRFFYNRVKGELEADLRQEEFQSLTLVRPGLIGGNRDEFRAGERFATAVIKVIGPMLPRKWRINPAERIARTLLDAAVNPPPGVTIISAEALAD
jgi:uncharacterized protein YbjT (DUF2867 family)